MPPVLVIGDSEADALSLQQIVARAGFDCIPVFDLPAIVACLEQNSRSLVLVGRSSKGREQEWNANALSQKFPQTPVVAVIDEGNGNSAKNAIESGVAGCLPRSLLNSEVAPTLNAILGHHHDAEARAARDESAWSMSYTIENNPDLLPLVVSEVRRRMTDWPFRDPIELVRLTVALSESLDNALYHGNLELGSELRQGDGRAWRDESQRRRNSLPYCDRRIRFVGSIGDQDARFTVRDEGRGFDPGEQADCREMENLQRCSGRGLLLMQMYMDEVRYNESGNEVTLVKHAPK